MKNHKNNNYKSIRFIKFHDISIKKLKQPFFFNFKNLDYTLKYFRISLFLYRLFLNNIKTEKKSTSIINELPLLLYLKFCKSSKKNLHDIYLTKKIILQILGELDTHKKHIISTVQKTLCSNIAWEFFFWEFDDFTSYSKDVIHSYSLFASRDLAKVARSGYSFLTKIPLDTYLFRKDPCSVGCTLLRRESRERILCETFLVGSRDFYAHGEYRLRLLAVGIGFPWIAACKTKNIGLFNNLLGTKARKHVPQNVNIRTHGTTLSITFHDRETFSIPGVTHTNTTLKNLSIIESPDVLLLSEKLAFFKEGYNDTVAFSSLAKAVSYRLWFKTILLLDTTILGDKSYSSHFPGGDISISHNIRTNFLWTLDLLSTALFDRFRKSFTLKTPVIKESLQTNKHIIGKSVILMDHVRKIEHVITSVFIHLFFNINSKFHISSFKGLNMIRKQNNINSYNYGHFIDVLKNINIPTDYQPIKTIYFLGIIINIIDNTKKIHLINSSLLHFPEKMCFSEDYNSFFSFNKKKINNEFFFNDRVALGFSRSFLRYLHGIFYTEIEYFTLERNSILFFNRISELVVRILLQNTYSDSSIQIRDYREHAEDFTTKSFYNHRWFGYLQLQQKVTPLTDDIQILKDTAIHLTMPSLRFSINPNQDALIQRLEITEDDLDYYRTSEFYTPLIDECAQKLILTSSNYPNLILNQEKKPKNKPIFHDMHESEKNQIIGFSNNFSILDASLITDTIPEGPYHYLDTNDNREDLSELSIENAFSETVENFDSNKNKFIHFSIIKNNTVTTHGISSLNASTHKDLSILLFITFYARILEHSGYHNTITKNLKRLHSVYKTSLYRNYRVQNLSSQNQLYDSAEYLRTAKDEEPHYVTSVEDGNTMSRIDEMESVFEDYYWEGLLLNQSEDTDDYDDEDETYSDDELFFEEINQDFVEAGNALSNLKPENVLGVHAFLYSEDFYETKEDHLERPDITLNTKSNSIMSSLIKDYDYTFPWAELYEAELEKFETDPLENQRMFSHRHLDLLELFSYQKWRQEYFLTKKLQGEEQSEIDILFDYEIRDIFNSSVQLNGIMREDTLNREAFPDEDTLSDEWYEEDPDYSYYYDKLRFQGLNLSDLVILRSQTHPSLNVPVYANLYIDQVAGLSTNLTLIINSCKKLSESAISLISFEAMRSLDAEGSYFSIAHLTTVKAPDDDDDFCCSIHSGISIYKDRFGQSYSYCLLYEEEYMTWDCINTEMTLSNVLHEIPFMITNTFYCDVVIDVDMYFLFEHTGFEIEFSIDKSLDPAVSVEYDLNYIEISPTPDIEMLVILYIYPNFYYYILLLEETEILLPGCFMLLDLISSFISDPLLDNFETHDYYLIDDDHFEPLELYNEVATEEEFRLLMKKNRSSFIKKALQKTWMFITRK